MLELAPAIDAVLVPAGTVITQKGDSPVLELNSDNRVFLLTLKITEALEQEYMELWLQGSVDGATWGATPLATLPQRFYPGEYPTLIDLSADTATKFVRVHWEVLRWGRSELTPRFVCGITFKEVPPGLLMEARTEARARR